MVYRLRITCELKQWHLDEEHRTVTGIIHNTTNQKEYPEGEKYSILNYKGRTHYPAFDVDPVANKEHWLVETHMSNFFVLYTAEERK